jgi:hypothetical protein
MLLTPATSSLLHWGQGSLSEVRIKAIRRDRRPWLFRSHPNTLQHIWCCLYYRDYNGEDNIKGSAGLNSRRLVLNRRLYRSCHGKNTRWHHACFVTLYSCNETTVGICCTCSASYKSGLEERCKYLDRSLISVSCRYSWPDCYKRGSHT